MGLICSCLPIIRGLFRALKLTNRSNRSDRPYYINTDISISGFWSKPSPRPPDLEFVNMEADMYWRQLEQKGFGAGRGRLLGDDLQPLNIKVQTDIAITPEHESTTSANMYQWQRGISCCTDGMLL